MRLEIKLRTSTSAQTAIFLIGLIGGIASISAGWFFGNPWEKPGVAATTIIMAATGTKISLKRNSNE
ncbi:hypothetical protein ACQ4M3_07760 [Leptolyngbya sp. AN03gr2]|uniref:hypothetical protein n=1 Tax=unclassified Leptolyngbya TaxID=2650499 RepID=UPI003D31AE49